MNKEYYSSFSRELSAFDNNTVSSDITRDNMYEAIRHISKDFMMYPTTDITVDINTHNINYN
jgi:hypothetical protein